MYKIIDGHCDTLTYLLDKSYTLVNSTSHVNMDKLLKGNVYIQFFAAWIGSRQKYGSPLQRGIKLIDRYYTMINDNPNFLIPILEYGDIDRIKCNQLGTILAVEGGDVLEGDLSNLRILHRLGVRLLTLTWNNRNEISDGIMETNSRSGLSKFGISVVHEMNKLNMIIDVSHISVNGFWDVIGLSKVPIIASHSNAKSICPHPRNLDDSQILAIAEAKGLVGINFYSSFLTEGEGQIDDIIRHIEYLAGLGGINIIGFGSDFDGIDRPPKDIEGPQDYPKIIERLLQLNYSEQDIEKICSGNFLRIIKDIMK